MKRSPIILIFLCFLSQPLLAQNYGNGLPATDVLGRKLPSPAEAGLPEKKFVGLFYWTWHTHFAQTKTCIPHKIIQKKPEARFDYNDPTWPTAGYSYYWGEPLWGFYRDTDRWVLRKQAELLADAGIDLIVFDCTNGSFTWKESYMELCSVFMEARKAGVQTPQIAFMLAFGPLSGSLQAITEIYNDLYKPGLYQNLFFIWKGKPLIMAYPEMLAGVPGNAEATRLHREIRNYFTFRPGQPVYNTGPTRPDQWSWLEIFPQHGFAPTPKGGFEQVSVGVAQNWTAGKGLSAMNMPGAFGRSYTHVNGHNPTAGAVDYGYNFQEQWDRAIEIDPELVFITGWNEWTMGRFDNWQGQPNAFPDQFDQEYSRDIEPMKGGHGDNYYYQMVSNIRRFKGMVPPEESSAPKSIKIDGQFDD